MLPVGSFGVVIKGMFRGTAVAVKQVGVQQLHAL